MYVGQTTGWAEEADRMTVEQAAALRGGVEEPEVNGFEQRVSVDRATLLVGANVSSGGCNSLPKPELYVRIRCALGAGQSCGYRVRLTLFPKHIRPGYDATLSVPLEPGAADGSSILLLQVDLGEIKIPGPLAG